MPYITRTTPGIFLWLCLILSGFAAENGRLELTGQVPKVVSQLVPKSRLSATNRLYLAIGLPLRNQAELGELQRELYDPASTNYHKYLTPQQFTERFGPTAEEYQSVVDFAQTNGLTIAQIHDDRKLLDVTGNAADIERIFHIKLNVYRHPSEDRDFFAPDVDPSVPDTLPVVHIQGLSDYWRPHPMSRPEPMVPQGHAGKSNSGSGSGGTYFGGDFRAAYVPNTPLKGSGQIVGLVQFDGFYTNDITSYESQARLPDVPLQTILLDGFAGTPTTGPNSGNGEVSLDIEMVIAMAPAISKLMVYEGNPNNFIPDDVLSQIATDNQARQVSSSWSWSGGPDTTADGYLSQMILQGQSVFFASGDSDAYTGTNVADTVTSFTAPITSTNVVAVGGTTLTTAGPGGAWTSETVWNWNNSGRPNVGSSGGTSTYYTIPWWQTNTTTVGNDRSSTFRNLPDVALTADNVYVLYGNGQSGSFGGTSCAAPLWAGFTALINQQAAFGHLAPVGFLSPALYGLAAGTNYNSLFHDITTGNNIGVDTPGLYYAVAGYDLCTGLGTPNGTNLINALAPVPFISIITNAGWTLISESATPANGYIDPGETVTVGFNLQNIGNLVTANLVATLLPSGNILAPSGPQTYGSVTAYGGGGSRQFTFTAAGSCGSTITATFQLQDGPNDLGTVTFTLPLGQSLGPENFDSVTAPALPAGWSSVNITGTVNNWATTTASFDTPPNSAFISDTSTVSENALVSPVYPIGATNGQLTFQHNFSFDYHSTGSSHYRDGGVLQIRIGNGGFTDIVTAGGSIAVGGYNGTISATSNPLGQVAAWVHNSGGWRTVTVNLPPSATGQNVQFRWVEGTDSTSSGSGNVGWYVDSVSVTGMVPNCLSVFTDVAIGQSLAATSYQAGQNLDYTIAVTNLGPQAAANVVVRDSVPVNASLVSAPGGSISGGQVLFTVPLLAVNAVTNFTLTLSPASGNAFTNFATVATVTPEIGVTNSSSTLISTQTTGSAPSITTPLMSQTIQCGSNASFTVTASGSLPLYYAWSLDGTPIIAATNTVLSLTNIHLPSHTVAVVVSNFYGSATSSVPLVVQDTLPPTISMHGANPLSMQFGAAYVELGATAADLCAGSVAVSISGVVNTNAVSTNVVTYTASDGNGNTATTNRTVYVVDTKPPTISWSFTNLVLAANSNCVATMPNVTGTNYIQATDLSGISSTVQSPTNNATLPMGTNVVVIAVADPYGNTAYSTNQIVVRDLTPPVIVLNGLAQMTNQLGAAFTDPGATASDTCSGVALFRTNGVVNVNVAGTNTLTYMAVDGSANTNIVTRTVLVVDTTPPTILWSFTNLLLAANSNCVAIMPNVTGTNYIQATDLSGVASTVQSPTNNAILPLGTNTVVIAVSDPYGNTAYSTNQIVVSDQTPPVIVLNGTAQMTNQLGAVFTDPGATASDNCSGLVLFATNGTVNVNVVGTNILTYTAADGAGNTNMTTRTVFVVDTIPPTIVWNFTNLVLAANSNCVVAMPDVTGTNYVQISDLSGVAVVSQMPTNNYLLPPGTNIIVLVATDVYGNTAYATNAIIVQDQTPPQILLQPVSLTNNAGTTAMFNVAATACTPLAFAWSFNNGPLVAQTNSTLVLSNLSLAMAGNYAVIVSAQGGSVTSSVASLTVYVPPGIGGIFENTNGTVALNLTGLPGDTYILESATNLGFSMNWLYLATNTLGSNGVWQFTDVQATNFPQQFYRLMLAP